MDVRIETFFTLCQTMNYHETARQLNMTQPAVTQHIKSLEAEYGCRFFIYDRKKLSKTKEADIFEAYARSIIFNLNRLRSALSKPKVRCMHIGATKSIGEFMLEDMAAEFLKSPDRTAEITVDNTENLLKMLDNGKIEFAMVEGEFSKVRYAGRLFRREPLYGICPRGHRLAGKTVKPEELFSETFIAREYGSGTRSIFNDILNSLGYSQESFARVVTISEFSLLRGLVARGVGISFVYAAVAKSSSETDTFFIEGINPTHDLNYVYLRDTAAEAIVEDFIRYGSGCGE